MNLYFFKATHGNFGDDLNNWLWPRVFGAEIHNAPQTTFIGIGSILDSRLERIPGNKIIFGTGVRSMRNLPAPDERTHIRFVRGPISAAALGNGTAFITDPAILVGSIAARPNAEAHAVGFMPHYHSLSAVDWERLCARVGFVFIDPRGGVDQTIAMLCRCDRVITEAMHGAIVADALRIPWHRVSLLAWQREGFDVSSLKWLDWGLSAQVDITPTHFGLDRIRPASWGRRLANRALQYADRGRLSKALEQLRRNASYQLSSGRTYGVLSARIAEQVDGMRSWLRRGSGG